MEYLKTNELKNIVGGGIGWSLIIGIGIAITFVVGFIDGIVRPYACRK